MLVLRCQAKIKEDRVKEVFLLVGLAYRVILIKVTLYKVKINEEKAITGLKIERPFKILKAKTDVNC